MRKVSKIIIYYDDGTFEEIKQSYFPRMPENPFPFKPYTSDTPFTPDTSPKWKPIDKCEKCGLELKGPMGYVCTNYPCPCGLGGAWSSSGTN